MDAQPCQERSACSEQASHVQRGIATAGIEGFGAGKTNRSSRHAPIVWYDRRIRPESRSPRASLSAAIARKLCYKIRNEISPILAAWHGWFHLGSCPLSGEAFRFDDLVGAGGDYNGQTVEAPEVPCGDDLLVK